MNLLTCSKRDPASKYKWQRVKDNTAYQLQPSISSLHNINKKKRFSEHQEVRWIGRNVFFQGKHVLIQQQLQKVKKEKQLASHCSRANNRKTMDLCSVEIWVVLFLWSNSRIIKVALSLWPHKISSLRFLTSSTGLGTSSNSCWSP